jgi:lactobin A/cerein 7B family class IIb bacteriocin
MKTLDTTEIQHVTGGIGPGGAVLGAIGGGVSAAINGEGARGIALGATLGAIAGFTGGLALASSGGARLLWSFRSVAATALSSLEKK